jgi:hypothetical protein
LEYTLVNKSTETVVAFTGIPSKDTGRAPVASQNAAYVYARSDGTVEIGRRLFAPPKGVAPAVDFLVVGETLAPGATTSGTLRLALPLSARVPYDSKASLPSRAGKAVFCVGVARQAAVPVAPGADLTLSATRAASPVGAPERVLVHLAGHRRPTREFDRATVDRAIIDLG